MVRIYVHRNFECFDNDRALRVFNNCRGTDITDVVCLDFFHTKYFHSRKELYERYSRTNIERNFWRYL